MTIMSAKKIAIGGKKPTETKKVEAKGTKVKSTPTINKFKAGIKAKPVTEKKTNPNTRGRKAGMKKVVSEKDIKKLSTLFEECAELYEKVEEPLNLFMEKGNQKASKEARVFAGELKNKVVELWRFIHEAKKGMKEVKVDKYK